MHCPLCTTTLNATLLEETLPALTCPTCAGLWIASTDYWAWLEQPPSDMRLGVAAVVGPTSDVARAKCCPGCGHLALSYPIARELPFRIDQCGHCNSFWLDRDEWPVLAQHGLHRQLHRITNGPWQRQLRAEERQVAIDAWYTTRLGAADYAEIRRVERWLADHPERLLLLAVLTNAAPSR